MSKFRPIWMLLAALSALILDVCSKVWAHNALLSCLREPFIPGLLNLLLTTNTGFAFSIAYGHQMFAQIIATSVFMALLWIYFKRYRNLSHPWLEQLGMSIIIGAAAGNLLERFIYGHVTDFIEFSFISFPVFNVADALIDVGVGLIFVSMCLTKKQK